MKLVSFEQREGLSAYKELWDYQREISEKVRNNPDENYAGHCIFCEHNHVYTLGRNGKYSNLLLQPEYLNNINAEFFHTDRGGDITYHGPGQLVGYPIFWLTKMKTGVKMYVHKLEQSIISVLSEFGIHASTLQGATGVWLDAETHVARKICAIGVKVTHGITMHGFAFNINTNLDYFNYINPCGFQDKGVTSLSKELGETQNFQEISQLLFRQILNHFTLEETECNF